MFSIKALKPSFRSRSELEQVWKKATRLRFRNGSGYVRFKKSLQSDQNPHFLLLFLARSQVCEALDCCRESGF